ncbi:unnamed protein product [Notodromas monacha]|uniref:Aldehyde dehydrogenase domain-containing protein n=1 Tax=Notodromas monacha TaxID=399045 RepID=A0A7R9BQR3_9CRUS|nr:unnamed protein product [Notodromas monacha]CAG0918589.1 unnamed protein product [Notodromas monacha]
MSVLLVKNFIGGVFVEPVACLDSFEPATGKLFASIPDSSADSVDCAVAAARSAFEHWSSTPIAKRADLLLKLADAIEENADELAELESRDQGKPLWLAKAVDIPRAVTNFRLFARAVPHQTGKSKVQEEFSAVNWTEREAVGVCGLISPWNLPLYLLTFKMAPALMAGNTIVCKPSEMTSVTAFKLCHLVSRVGFPPGVVNVVFGTGPGVGERLVSHPDVPVVSFTGSTVTGKRIAMAAAPFMKKLSLEMGGKNAGIIFDDVDLETSGEGSLISTLLRSCFINQGEVCLCTSRLYVQETIFDAFLRKFVPAVRELKVGPNEVPGVFCGALVSKEHKAKVLHYVGVAKNEGGVLHCGHGVDELVLPEGYENGYYVQPTVISGLDETSSCITEEIFGPVVTVSKFTDEADAISKANAVEYGLCASVWSKNVSTCMRMSRALKVGTVWVNCWMVRCLDMPFGGVKASGRGREGIEESMEFYTESKTICLKY